MRFRGFLLEENNLCDTTVSINAAKFIIVKSTDDCITKMRDTYERPPIFPDFPGFRVKIKIRPGTIAGCFHCDLPRDQWAGKAFEINVNIRAYAYKPCGKGHEFILESMTLI